MALVGLYKILDVYRLLIGVAGDGRLAYQFVP
jgi:hypothetical protein